MVQFVNRPGWLVLGVSLEASLHNYRLQGRTAMFSNCRQKWHILLIICALRSCVNKAGCKLALDVEFLCSALVREQGRLQACTRCCVLHRNAELLWTRPDGPRILAVAALHWAQVVKASSSIIIRIMIINIIIICIIIIIDIINNITTICLLVLYLIMMILIIIMIILIIVASH